MRITLGTVKESLEIGVVSAGVVHTSRQAFARNPVTLNIAQVRTCRAEISSSLADISGPDDHAPSAGRKQACGRKCSGAHAAPEV
jgi:hypothetical protein